jgi:tetrahydromethanopterin S-methyltransferase subunit B
MEVLLRKENTVQDDMIESLDQGITVLHMLPIRYGTVTNFLFFCSTVYSLYSQNVVSTI